MDICKSLVEEGLRAAVKRSAEREMFAAAHSAAQEANKAAALTMIASYESQKAEVGKGAHFTCALWVASVACNVRIYCVSGCCLRVVPCTSCGGL